MALIAFSLVMNVQPNQPIGMSHRGCVETVHAPHSDVTRNEYHVLLQLSADNPRPAYDGDEYFDSITLVRTQLVAQDTGYTFTDEVFEIVRRKVLALLAELERTGWKVTYEQTYFQQLVLADDEKWHFKTLPSSQVLFQVWLLHQQKPPYSPDSGLRVLNWMRQNAAAG